MIGIYAVTNTVTGQMYIGRAVDMQARLNQHFNALRCHNHTNPYLQNSFNKYGKAAFAFEIMIVCRRKDNPFYERLLVAGFKTSDPRFGFNLTTPCLNVMTHTDKAKAAIGAFQKVYQATNHYVMTGEIREKIAAGLRGKVGCNKGRVWSPEVRAKMGAPKGNRNRLGKTFTPEQRAKISAGMVAAHAINPGLREVPAAANRGTKASAETKAKMTASHKIMWAARRSATVSTAQSVLFPTNEND